MASVTVPGQFPTLTAALSAGSTTVLVQAGTVTELPDITVAAAITCEPGATLTVSQPSGALVSASLTLTSCAVTSATGYERLLEVRAATTLTDCDLSGGQADEGGGIEVDAAPLTVVGGSLHNLAATGRGGAIACNNAGALVLEGVRFADDVAPEGGAVWANDCAVTSSDGVWTGNFASTDDGGAIRWTGQAADVLSFTGDTFDGNFALSGEGGAVHATGGLLRLSGVVVKGSEAERAAVVSRLGSVEVTDSRFCDNLGALYSGSAVYVEDPTARPTVTGSLFLRNHTGEWGALRVNGGGLDLSASTFVANEAMAKVASSDVEAAALAVDRGSSAQLTDISGALFVDHAVGESVMWFERSVVTFTTTGSYDSIVPVVAGPTQNNATLLATDPIARPVPAGVCDWVPTVSKEAAGMGAPHAPEGPDPHTGGPVGGHTGDADTDTDVDTDTDTDTDADTDVEPGATAVGPSADPGCGCASGGPGLAPVAAVAALLRARRGGRARRPTGCRASRG